MKALGHHPAFPLLSAQPCATRMPLSTRGAQRLCVNETPDDLSEFTPGDQ